MPFRKILTGAMLIGVLCLTFWIRIQGPKNLPVGHFTEPDAFLYAWQADIIATQGYLPDKDMHRWLPQGRDNRQLLPLYSYAIGYIHIAIPWFSLYDIQSYAPVLCFMLGLCAVFAYLTYTSGVVFAFITTLFLATLPGCIERSSIGFGDRDAWCWILGVLAITSYLSKAFLNAKRQKIIASLLSGFFVLLGGLSWEGFGFFVLIIVAVELWKFCITDTEADLTEYILWLLMFAPLLYLISPVYRQGYGFSTHVFALLLLPTLIVFALRGSRYLLLRYIPTLQKHARSLAWGSMLLCVAMGIGYILMQYNTFETTAYAFRESKLMQIIGELEDPDLSYWTIRYGAVFMLGSLGLIGVVIHQWRWKGSLLAISLMLFVLTTFFSAPLNRMMSTSLCNIFFFISLGGIGIALGIASLRKTAAKDEQMILAMLAWFILWVALARGGKRYDFFIGLPLAYGTAWLLYIAPAYLIQYLKSKKIVYPEVSERWSVSVFTIIAIILFSFWSPLGGHVNRAVDAAGWREPIPGNSALNTASKWIKNALSPDNVVAADWEYGTQLNVHTDVKTITDSDHFLPHWVHLYYRHVFCAQTEQEALEFLKTHGATHLMITEADLLSYAHKYSWVGSNAQSDRHFTLYPLTHKQTSIGTPMRLVPSNPEVPLVYADIARPSHEKMTVKTHFKNHKSFTNEIVWDTDNPTQKTVPIENGGLVLYFFVNAKFRSAYAVSPIGWNSLAVKLYMRREHSNAFVQVYPSPKKTTAEVKIWQIHYPPDIKVNPKYLLTAPEKSNE